MPSDASKAGEEVAHLRRLLHRAEVALRSEREKYRLLIERSNVPFCAVSRDGTYLALSKRAAHNIKPGARPDELVGRNAAEFISGERLVRLRERLELVCTSGEGHNVEDSVQLSEGLRWFSSELQPFYDEFGVALGVHIISQDITDRRQTEDRLQAALREKDALLREVHHRVKNNLQIVSSLLSLQAGGGGIAERKLRESAERVQVIARIHERLYRSESLARVDFRSLATDLINDVLRNGATPGQVHVEIDIPVVYFTPELALPTGLILHELVRNSRDQGFGAEPGTLTVRLTRDPEGILVLTVSDPGRGLPPGARLRPDDTGASLIRALAQQLSATLTVHATDIAASFTLRLGQHVAPPSEI